MNLYVAGSVCPDALLRVPRPAASSFTCAEHPGSPIPGGWWFTTEDDAKPITSQQQGGANTTANFNIR